MLLHSIRGLIKQAVSLQERIKAQEEDKKEEEEGSEGQNLAKVELSKEAAAMD